MKSTVLIAPLALLHLFVSATLVHEGETVDLAHDKKSKTSHVKYNDPLFYEEWYINRKIGPTFNVKSVWPKYTGKGVVVAVVDDGVDGKHPDLIHSYKFSAGFDFVENDTDPRPKGRPVSGHGNNCAGIIAGRANNALCGVGLAYDAEIIGIRLFDNNIKSTDETESKALVQDLQEVDIYSNSWGPGDMAWQVKGPGVLTRSALKRGVREGRNGLGAIYTFAAGNGGIVGDSCAYNGYVNSIYTIAINGVNEDGSNPSYAEECPGIMATAYSRDTLRRIGKTITTDKHSGCTDTFGACSAATAMASGLIALAIEANPKLTWRDMQHIIVRSSRPAPGGTALKHGYWKTNKAGFKVSKFYGFGLMDAGKMVQKAKSWKTVPPQERCEIHGSAFYSSIPSTFSVSVTNQSCNISYLEHVQIRVSLDFRRRGDLGLELLAPSGTNSPLTRRRIFDNLTGYRKLSDWIITTLFNWGESPIGIWKLKVTNLDQRYNTKGTLNSWSLILYGTSLHPTKNKWQPSKAPSPNPPPSVKVDGKYSEWSYWTHCSKTCGRGTKRRFRACTNPRPQNGGMDCKTLPGSPIDLQDCNQNPCPVDGGFSKWSRWSKCTATCGQSYKYRSRTCTNPRPQHGGKICKGQRQMWHKCHTKPCPGVSMCKDYDQMCKYYKPWCSHDDVKIDCPKTCGSCIGMTKRSVHIPLCKATKLPNCHPLKWAYTCKIHANEWVKCRYNGKLLRCAKLLKYPMNYILCCNVSCN